MMDTLKLKGGAPLPLSLAFTEDDEVTPIDITGWEISVQVRAYPSMQAVGGLIYADITGGVGEAALVIPAEHLPAGFLAYDIRCVDAAGTPVHTETYYLDVIDPITRAAP